MPLSTIFQLYIEVVVYFDGGTLRCPPTKVPSTDKPYQIKPQSFSSNSMTQPQIVHLKNVERSLDILPEALGTIKNPSKLDKK